MERDAGLGALPMAIILIVLFLLGRFFLFPAVCQSIPLQLPGQEFDYCFFFR